MFSSEYIGIVNYCIMAQLQLEMGVSDETELSYERAESLYDSKAKETRTLMIMKNTDYGEAWRDMRVSSLTESDSNEDFTHAANRGTTMARLLISEGLDANYMDMMNYAMFALIRLS